MNEIIDRLAGGENWCPFCKKWLSDQDTKYSYGVCYCTGCSMDVSVESTLSHLRDEAAIIKREAEDGLDSGG